MTSNTLIAADQYTIAVTLDDDPEINYFGWRICVEDVAANAATLIEPTGLLTLVMTDGEWASYPANTTITAATAHAAATTTVAARPVEPTHSAIIAGMNGPAISIAQYGNKRHETWHNAKEQLKMTIVNSLETTLATTIAPPPLGFKVMNIRAIMDAVGLKYATVDWTSLNKMDEIMTTLLDNVMNLDKHLARLTRHINMSAAAGFNVEEYLRVKVFRQSVQHHHQIAETLKSFDRDHPNPRSHTYALITAHVLTQLPPILSAAGTSVATKNAFHAEPVMSHEQLVTAYAALVEQHRKGMATAKCPPKKTQNRDNKRRKGGMRTKGRQGACSTQGRRGPQSTMRLLLLCPRKAELSRLTPVQGHAQRQSTRHRCDAESQVAQRRPRRVNLREGTDRPSSPGTGIHGHRIQRLRRCGISPCTSRAL
jgi:hypothetical protein